MTVIEKVVQKDRCCSCGVCAGICPAACLEMKLQDNGDLAPSFSGQCEPKCRLCLAVCPFAPGIFDPRANLNRSLVEKDENNSPKLQHHEDVGPYIKSYVGYAEKHRTSSSSGGMATFTLKQLFERGEITRAAVVESVSDPSRGLLFNFRVVSSVDELERCAGSVYYPVEISSVLQAILLDPRTRWAIVGVPCLCAAVRRAMKSSQIIGQAVQYVFGLACGMYLNSMYTELLASESGVNWPDVATVRFRVKSDQDAPGNYGFVAISKSGQLGNVVKYGGLPEFLGRNGYFRLGACNYCMDVFAECADACFMDAWLPEYANDPKGTSIVLIRDVRVQQLLEECGRGGSATLQLIAIEKVVQSQWGAVRRKRKLIGMRLGNGQANILNWARWYVEKKTAKRSKLAWSNVGRKHGPKAFWSAMASLVMLQKLLDKINSSLWLAIRILKWLGVRRSRKISK